MLTRTQWALSGMTREVIMTKTRAAFADHTFQQPEPGAMTYMLSRRTVGPEGGPWLPHLMFFLPSTVAKTWGAGLDGSPIVNPGITDDNLGSTILLVPVRRWSDGSPARAGGCLAADLSRS